MSLTTFLRLLKSGDPVAAGGVNKPLRQTDDNVKYIWEVLQAATIGSTVYAHRQSVEAEAKLGAPVWLNPVTQRFERGLAVAAINPTTGAVVTAPSAQVWGIVARKINATLADVLLFGLADVDVSEAVLGDLAAGTYYLSGTAAGRLVLQSPPVSVAVLRRTPDGRVFVMPQFVDFLDRHVHYKFDLLCEPAGDVDPPQPGGVHVILNPSSALAGWLPADHASFEGKAPSGAVFGYNLAADPGLKNAWPPLPPSNADVQWDKGVNLDVGFTGVHLGREGLCLVDENGIWWLSNCYGDAPWPFDMTTTSSDSFSDSSSPECPRHLRMRMAIYFTKVTFLTDDTAVLSLHSGDARLKVRCFGDPARPATTGHLELLLDLNIVVGDDTTPGFLAFKEFDPRTTEFRRGPVVEALIAGSGNVTLSGPTTVREIDGVEETLVHGPVKISVAPEETRELDVQLVRLDGVQEQTFQNTMYLGFAAAENSAYRARIHVPADLSIPNPAMKVRLLLLGRAAGTLPQLTATYRRVPRPDDGLDDPLALPTADATLTLTTVATLASANQYVEADSEAFEIEPGDTVYFTVERGDGDGYGAEVGVLRQTGLVVTGG
jgi:hypothetical protein